MASHCSLKTWKHGHCLWSQLCRWGSDVGWQHSRHTPPGDRRGWRQWTLACPCTPYTSSPPAVAWAAPLHWGPSLSEETHRKTDEHTKTDHSVVLQIMQRLMSNLFPWWVFVSSHFQHKDPVSPLVLKNTNIKNVWLLLLLAITNSDIYCNVWIKAKWALVKLCVISGVKSIHLLPKLRYARPKNANKIRLFRFQKPSYMFVKIVNHLGRSSIRGLGSTESCSWLAHHNLIDNNKAIIAIWHKIQRDSTYIMEIHWTFMLWCCEKSIRKKVILIYVII